MRREKLAHMFVHQRIFGVPLGCLETETSINVGHCSDLINEGCIQGHCQQKQKFVCEDVPKDSRTKGKNMPS